jgi:hypothetical protein
LENSNYSFEASNILQFGPLTPRLMTKTSLFDDFPFPPAGNTRRMDIGRRIKEKLLSIIHRKKNFQMCFHGISSLLLSFSLTFSRLFYEECIMYCR